MKYIYLSFDKKGSCLFYLISWISIWLRKSSWRDVQMIFQKFWTFSVPIERYMKKVLIAMLRLFLLFGWKVLCSIRLPWRHFTEPLVNRLFGYGLLYKSLNKNFYLKTHIFQFFTIFARMFLSVPSITEDTATFILWLGLIICKYFW